MISRRTPTKAGIGRTASPGIGHSDDPGHRLQRRCPGVRWSILSEVNSSQRLFFVVVGAARHKLLSLRLRALQDQMPGVRITAEYRLRSGRHLLPGTLVLAHGFSSRTQIRHLQPDSGTGPQHSVEVLAAELTDKGQT